MRPRPVPPPPSEGRLQRAVGDSTWVYGSQGILVAFKFLQGFLVARFLGPTLYGLRSIFGIVTEYEALSHAGTFDAMQREVPYLRGRGEHAAATRVIESTFGLSVLYAAVVCVVLLGAGAGMAWAGFSGIWVVFILFTAVYTGVSRISRFYVTQLIVDQEARRLSHYRVIRGGLNAVLGVSLAYLYGLEGFLLGLLVAEALGLIWIARIAGPRPRVRVSLIEIRSLVAIGFPIMLVSVLFMVLRSLDRILVAGFLGQELLGYFAVATILANVMFDTLADVMRVVLFPRLMEAVGMGRDRADLKVTYLLDPSLLVAFALPFILGAIYLGVHLPFDYLVPEYSEAIRVTQILVMGQFFFAVSLASILGGIAMGRQVNIAALTALVVVVNGILNVAFIQAGFGISGVAVGTGLSYLVFTVLVVRFVLVQLGAGWREAVGFLSLAIVPFGYAVILLVLWDSVLIPHPPSASAMQDVGLTVLRWLGFGLTYAPVLLLLARRPIIVELRRTLSEARARR